MIKTKLPKPTKIKCTSKGWLVEFRNPPETPDDFWLMVKLCLQAKDPVKAIELMAEYNEKILDEY